MIIIRVNFHINVTKRRREDFDPNLERLENNEAATKTYTLNNITIVELKSGVNIFFLNCD